MNKARKYIASLLLLSILNTACVSDAFIGAHAFERGKFILYDEGDIFGDIMSSFGFIFQIFIPYMPVYTPKKNNQMDTKEVDEENIRFIYCKTIGRYDNVKQLDYNSILLRDSGIVSMAKPLLMSYIADFTVTIKEGQGVRFYLRNSPNKFKSFKGVSLTFSKEGLFFEENGKVQAKYSGYQAEIGRQYRLKIKNDGKYAKVYLDCDEMREYVCNLPLSEYIIAESIGASTVELKAIDLYSLW
jgi:hypothetical protein